MIKNKKILNHLALGVAVAFLVTNIGLLVWYLFIEYQPEFHSDSAVKVLLAREIFDTKDYFPNDWNYINNDLFVFFGHTFIIPLLGFMPAGFTVHAISGLIFSILLLSAIWFISGITNLSLARRIFIVAVAAAGVSSFMAENLYGQVSYGFDVTVCCYLIVFAWKFFKSNGKFAVVWGAVFFLLVTLVYWENPQRATISYGLPFLAAVCWLLWMGNAVGRHKLWQALAIFFIGIVIGASLHLYTLSGVINILTVGNALWLPYQLMLKNLSLVPLGVLSIFGGFPTPGKPMVSPTGVYEALRLAVAVITTLLVPWAVYKAFRYADDGMKFFGGFAVMAFAGVFFIYITTTLADMSDPVQSARYLVPSLFLGFITLLMSPIDRVRSPLPAIGMTFMIVFYLVNGYLVYHSSPKERAEMAWGQPGQYHMQLQDLVDFLVANKLEYGYATYWNAGVVSVLSDEKSLVRQISIKNGIPVPVRHLSSNRWYRPSAWHGETFLLLTNEEAKHIKWDALEEYNVEPIRHYAIKDFEIYVFKDNLANHLPGWDASFEAPFTFKMNEHASKQIGHFEKEAHVLVAGQGESGALHYGPYITVDPGHYKVSFDILAAHNPAGVVRLDVVGNEGKMYAETTLTSSEHPQPLYFTLDKPQTMEFRVWALGNERLELKGITLERLPSANAQ